ncbi:hypothetical protein CEXT_224821 [Caerostris extrusa]|uniref:Uncharacterized protein n=1 Tax=Caerostris extrusa TaxID=172846 RepID=A0AAV4NGT1_CAEEX|nr:hypothetical protein CEXT_224821 [Caerostris extrusa]
MELRELGSTLNKGRRTTSKSMLWVIINIGSDSSGPSKAALLPKEKTIPRKETGFYNQSLQSGWTLHWPTKPPVTNPGNRQAYPETETPKIGTCMSSNPLKRRVGRRASLLSEEKGMCPWEDTKILRGLEWQQL